MRYEVDQLRGRGTFVVAAFGHGDTHVDVNADVHAHTPTSGAEVIRRKFHDVPMLQRQAVAGHRTRLDALAFDGHEDLAAVRAEFTRALEAIDAETDEFVERQRQRDPVQDWLRKGTRAPLSIHHWVERAAEHSRQDTALSCHRFNR